MNAERHGRRPSKPRAARPSSPTSAPLISWAARSGRRGRPRRRGRRAWAGPTRRTSPRWYRTWNREPDYSHGFLVLPIALVILWKTLAAGPDDARPAPWLAGLAAGDRGAWRPGPSSTSGARPGRSRPRSCRSIAGLGLARLGWRTMLRTWPAFAFLVFLFPLPPQINTALSQPLQSLATTLRLLAPEADRASG